LTDFVSGNPPFSDSTDTADWRRCHAEFVSASSKRTGIVAYGSGHYIFRDNRPLVVMAIAKAYANISGGGSAKKYFGVQWIIRSTRSITPRKQKLHSGTRRLTCKKGVGTAFAVRTIITG
jgi:hypothetical protein